VVQIPLLLPSMVAVQVSVAGSLILTIPRVHITAHPSRLGITIEKGCQRQARLLCCLAKHGIDPPVTCIALLSVGQEHKHRFLVLEMLAHQLQVRRGLAGMAGLIFLQPQEGQVSRGQSKESTTRPLFPFFALSRICFWGRRWAERVLDPTRPGCGNCHIYRIALLPEEAHRHPNGVEIT
jgi:hypothetical protein